MESCYYLYFHLSLMFFIFRQLTRDWSGPTSPFLWSQSLGRLLGIQCLPTVWLPSTPVSLSASKGPIAEGTKSVSYFHRHFTEDRKVQVRWLIIWSEVVHNIFGSQSMFSSIPNHACLLYSLHGCLQAKYAFFNWQKIKVLFLLM